MANRKEVVVGLARVSTLGQVEHGTSLDGQEAAIRKWAADQNCEVRHIYREDGKSGALYLARLDVQSALRDIEEGRAHVLVTHKMDRAGRDVDVLRQIKRRVESAGGRLVFADGMDFAPNAAGKFMFNNMANYA